MRELRRTLEHAKTAKDELQQKLGEMALRERLQLQADEELKRTNAAMANQLSEAKHKTTNLKSKNKELQAQVSPASLVDPIPPNAVNSSVAILAQRILALGISAQGILAQRILAQGIPTVVDGLSPSNGL